MPEKPDVAKESPEFQKSRRIRHYQTSTYEDALSPTPRHPTTERSVAIDAGSLEGHPPRWCVQKLSPDPLRNSLACQEGRPRVAPARKLGYRPRAMATPVLHKRGDLDPRSLRPVTMELDFHSMAEGSVLYKAGKTVVLCTASIEDTVPDWLRGRGTGWITAEYQMHPRSNPQRREKRDGRKGSLSGRTREIERLIGRSLRAAVDLKRLGERSITLDCDVLEADGGTRTASITGGFVALALATHRLLEKGLLSRSFLCDPIAAVSVGHVDGALALDLCYAEDSTARVDLNLVATPNGAIVEVQGTAEGRPVPRAEIDAMIDLGLEGISRLGELQESTLARAGVRLAELMSS